MCMVCVNAPRAHISAQSSFMPVRVERRRRMREGCFVQRRSGVACRRGEERGGGGGCVNTELTLERLEKREVETGRGGDEGG